MSWCAASTASASLKTLKTITGAKKYNNYGKT